MFQIPKQKAGKTEKTIDQYLSKAQSQNTGKLNPEIYKEDNI